MILWWNQQPFNSHTFCLINSMTKPLIALPQSESCVISLGIDFGFWLLSSAMDIDSAKKQRRDRQSSSVAHSLRVFVFNFISDFLSRFHRVLSVQVDFKINLFVSHTARRHIYVCDTELTSQFTGTAH